ncbi:hypothetical protein KDW_43300 [Dictyobacter vulcani]|uniref:Uncharacterized protein n=1 Tax=Dictyobacter vulcani TaxID=2607529 RepID=A0A5J4KK97_9CHLR|nr:hypothetical protein KDW_43300 [Dictyobacter vulcani]
MKGSSLCFAEENGTRVLLRKVSRCGHICYHGQLYFVTKALAGQHLQIQVSSQQLVVKAVIPVYKAYELRK